MDEFQDRAEGQAGPGLEPREGIDRTLIVAWIGVIVGYTPWQWWRSGIGFGYFGPIEVPAILAMVGVLFAFIALLRAVDLKDTRQRTAAVAAMAVGLLRLFLLPFV